ncbi:hypothetical protein V8F33_007930 [Rhypophila sp. PSN 637]
MGVVTSIPTGSVGLLALALAATAAVPVVAGAHADLDMHQAAVPSAMIGGGAAQPVVNMNADYMYADSFAAGGALHDSSFSKPYPRS